MRCVPDTREKKLKRLLNMNDSENVDSVEFKITT